MSNIVFKTFTLDTTIKLINKDTQKMPFFLDSALDNNKDNRIRTKIIDAKEYWDKKIKTKHEIVIKVNGI
jgi:hypothetical protein